MDIKEKYKIAKTTGLLNYISLSWLNFWLYNERFIPWKVIESTKNFIRYIKLPSYKKSWKTYDLLYNLKINEKTKPITTNKKTSWKTLR